MSIESILDENEDGNPRSIRIRVIRPVWDTVEIDVKLGDHFGPDKKVTTSDEVFRLFSFLSDETKEHFLALHLDSKNRLLCLDHVSIGSLNASVVHPREIFKSCLLSSAAVIILIHNHPSGDPTPSREDMELTARLGEAGELLGIRVLDHIIIGSGCYVSLADRGLL